MSELVQIKDLTIAYQMGQAAIYAVDQVTLDIKQGETIGIVGESGSGKSTLGMAIGKLLSQNAVVEAGQITIGSDQVQDCSGEELRRIRRDRLGFVFQNPMTALDPTMRIDKQVSLAFARKSTPDERLSLLRRSGLENAEQVAKSYPHELSGGMAQRVVIALSIARNPELIIADEPTASLDASIQDKILDLMIQLRDEAGASMVLLSHDLGMVAKRCDRVAVMYGGRIVEIGNSKSVFEDPKHPYTRALIKAAAGNEKPGERLEPIGGVPPVLRTSSTYCAFADRCGFAKDICFSKRPETHSEEGVMVTCHFEAKQLAGDEIVDEVRA